MGSVYGLFKKEIVVFRNARLKAVLEVDVFYLENAISPSLLVLYVTASNMESVFGVHAHYS